MLTWMLMVNCVLDWHYEHTYATKQLLAQQKDRKLSGRQWLHSSLGVTQRRDEYE